MGDEMKDKLFGLLEKVGLSSELVDKIKGELSEGKEVEITKVEVKGEINSDDIDEMSPEEAKEAFKIHLGNCNPKKKEKEKGDKVLDRMKRGMYN